jgi:beta-galactosidase/beta-glucuronidase
MAANRTTVSILAVWLTIGVAGFVCHAQPAAQNDAPLPKGVKAVWGLDKAWREKTPTRERVCLNGLWRWQPAGESTDAVPVERWGYFKVPGCWPGISDYMQKDTQTVYLHDDWKDQRLGEVKAAWYQREIEVPKEWAGRRIVLSAEYLNSYAQAYVDGKKAGEMRFPAGEVDLTQVCKPGGKHVLSMLVVALPLKGVMMSYNDTASAREVKGSVARRGLCGDVYLVGEPAGPRIAAVKLDTSVRKWEITIGAAIQGLDGDKSYVFHTQVTDGDKSVKEFWSQPFKASELKDGRIAFTDKWKPSKLWDIHTPQNVYHLVLTLQGVVEGKVLDEALPVRFGFREFWIDGRDFYLNGSRIFLFAVPLDNAEVSADSASYASACESMKRLKSIGVNFVYTHNYGCEPGSHLGFAEILRAADDVGMLVSFSQPHFGQYDWKSPDADRTNGYARHAEFYVRVAQEHPSVVFYSMSHNATGYAEDMNPDMIDGKEVKLDPWAARNVKLALRAEAIVHALDPGRIVYHHSSGNLSSMHTVNFYPNFAPIQELSDWLEHWSVEGVKPFFACEYGAPCTWDWTMYRGWYNGKRSFGSAAVPWEFCFAEWNSQFLGDRAFKLCEAEKRNLRWETQQFRAGKVWHRWDYPFEVGSTAFDDRFEVFAMYTTDNLRAQRTWGISAANAWEYGFYWKLRDGMDRNHRDELKVDWDNLQRPGFSADYLQDRYERFDMTYELSDWVPTPAAKALLRNNGPLLAYIAGGPLHRTEKDHNYTQGGSVTKTIIVINNSRQTVNYDCQWSVGLPRPVTGSIRDVLETGSMRLNQMDFDLPRDLPPGAYEMKLTARFDKGEPQSDSFTIHVLPASIKPKTTARIALLDDPEGETAKVVDDLGIKWQLVKADADLSAYDILIIGKGALTTDGPGPDLARVRDGLKVIVFEQTAEVLEKRLGFRATEYGLRQVFKRVPDHPLLAGLDTENLRDWKGAATNTPPQLKYILSERLNGVPVVKWCGLEETRVWRCGNWGNVASVLIEKPARGDFLPILDGGFSLQYSPLMEYREGKGMVLFCQMDVTGRTQDDPAAERLVRNIIEYVSMWKPPASRKALYAGDAAGKDHLEKAGVSIGAYEGGKLSVDQVLVVGPGGGEKLAASSAAIDQWLKAGGHILAVGLDETDAGSLPGKVTMTKAEHIAACFDPPAKDSPLAGVGPADMHNRDPRQLPLVTGGAQINGDGVLATAQGGNVVFCQMAPWTFDYGKRYNLKRTFRRASFTLTRLLANMGVASSTPLLARFKTPPDASKQESRWQEGLYLDQPEENDDPYRFFRW